MKSKILWPLVLILVFAVSRWPGAMPQNFSAAYALCFCAGLYLPRRLAWLVPACVVIPMDLALTFLYYRLADYTLLHFAIDQAPVYLAYGLIIWLGTLLAGRKSSLVTLLSGGIFGAIIFYLISNTASWLTMPEYGKTLAEWIRALTTGDPRFPPTWEFFRGTLFSGALFTFLFVAAMKFTEATQESPAEKGEETAEDETEESEPAVTPATEDAPHPAS